MTPRQVYLRNRQRRQNKVFALITMVLALALAIALLMMAGLIPLPIGNEFSKKDHFAAAGDIPCPTTDASPTPAHEIHVQILNGTTRQGIAGSATSILESLGYYVTPPENAQKEYPGSVEIATGPLGVNDAWTLARLFPKARITLTEATDRRVTITLGSFYDTPLEADEAKRTAENRDPLKGTEKCLPVDPEVLADLQERQAQLQSGAQSGGDAQSAGGTQPTDTPQSAQ